MTLEKRKLYLLRNVTLGFMVAAVTSGQLRVHRHPRFFSTDGLPKKLQARKISVGPKFEP